MTSYEATIGVMVSDFEQEVEVVYSHTPGAKEIPPSLNNPGEPADPDYVEINSMFVGSKEVPLWFFQSVEDWMRDYILENHPL